jgi:hypothetical protein
MTTESIIPIRFADAGRAYQAFSELHHLDAGSGQPGYPQRRAAATAR